MYRYVVFILFICSFAFSQKYEDIVYLKDGSIIHGIIIERAPNRYIKIKSGKNVFVYEMHEIRKMTKEIVKVEQKTNDDKFYSLQARISANGFGNFNLSYLFEDIDEDVYTGFTGGLDLIFLKTKWMNFGVGYELQIQREIVDDGGKFGFNSYYIILQSEYGFTRLGNGNFHGDNIFTSNGYFNLSGRGYLSYGSLFEVADDSFFEISWSQFYGNIDFGGDRMYADYKTWNIGIVISL